MRHSDNLNGTFTNPIIFADYPDPDIIRAGPGLHLFRLDSFPQERKASR